jgi:hypothetical protein
LSSYIRLFTIDEKKIKGKKLQAYENLSIAVNAKEL